MYNRMTFEVRRPQRGSSMPAQQLNNYTSVHLNSSAKNKSTVASPVNMQRRAPSHSSANKLDLTVQAEPMRMTTVETPVRRQSANRVSFRRPTDLTDRGANRGAKTMSSLDTDRRGISTDYTYRKTGLSVGLVAGTKTDKPFGH